MAESVKLRCNADTVPNRLVFPIQQLHFTFKNRLALKNLVAKADKQIAMLIGQMQL